MLEYHFPPIDLLMNNTESSTFVQQAYIQNLADSIESMFDSFDIPVKIVDITSNELAIVLKLVIGEGVSVEIFETLGHDIEMHARAPVEVLVDNKNKCIFLAVRNISRPHVAIKDILCCSKYKESRSKLTIAAGLNLLGGHFVFDLAELPNLLVAGVTGSGKSVFLHNIILSILYKARPDEVKLLLFDMKGVEFPLLDGIPHMLQKTIVDTETGLAVLRWLQNEKDNRLYQLQKTKTETIDEYNQQAKTPFPRIVVIIDEFMEYVRKKSKAINYYDEFNALLEELVKSSGMTGIHLVLATQRPASDVITPTIKNLIPCRASFVVVDKRESEIILRQSGAERLLGQGDMIFTRNPDDQGIHAQIAYVSDIEIDKVAAYLSRESGVFGTKPIVPDSEIKSIK